MSDRRAELPPIDHVIDPELIPDTFEQLGALFATIRDCAGNELRVQQLCRLGAESARNACDWSGGAMEAFRQIFEDHAAAPAASPLVGEGGGS